ncbi:MAG: hypothetical protein ACHQU0_00210 [Candidatus Paceibacteria bacterium]
MNEITSSATRGGKWLLSQDKPFNDPGIPWSLSVIQEKYCPDNPELVAKIKKSFSPFLSDPVERAYARLLDENDKRRIDYALLADRRIVFDDVIIPALYCDVAPLPESVHERILAGESRSGYMLTHSYLALLLMRSRGCADLEDLGTETRMAQKIAQEESQSSFDDVYAERVAFLEYGGRNDLIIPAWIASIIANQGVDGGWEAGPGSYLGSGENPHTTALALWALSSYGQTCPFKK